MRRAPEDGRALAPRSSLRENPLRKPRLSALYVQRRDAEETPMHDAPPETGERPHYRFLPHAPPRLAEAEMEARSSAFADELALRRSVRAFRPDPVPLDVLDECVRAAASAPSGANRQPWTFVVVTDPVTKRAIRLAAEEEERKSYAERMSDEWLAELEPLGTNAEKPFLELAPALLVVFRHAFGCEPGPWSLSRDAHERPYTNYYTQESVGIACGFLIPALHHAGLATLTHTPSPMGFLGRVLCRPENEKASSCSRSAIRRRTARSPTSRASHSTSCACMFDRPCKCGTCAVRPI